MRGIAPKPLPIALFALTLALEGAAVGLSWGLEPRYDTVLYAVDAAILGGAGVLVASRHPENPIGWLFCASALWTALAGDAAQGWGLRAVESGWAGGTLGELIALTSWLPSGLVMMLTFLLFPDGRLLRPAWRALVWANVLGIALAGPGWALSADLGPDFVGGTNAYAIDSALTGSLRVIGMTLFLGSFLLSVVPLTQRLRGSRGVERQQLKWIAFAAVCTVVLLALSAVLWNVTPIVRPLAAIAVAALPIATCVAIFRYRLYDVDLVISRTLAYGGLTVILAATYAVTVVVIGAAVGRSSAWATAGATLAVAAAFRPLRRRLQDVVDSRFNRARHHALHRMARFLDDLHAGRAAPEAIEGVLREVFGDPSLELHFFLPESQLYVDAFGMPAVGSPGDGRVRIPLERAGQPLGLVLHDPSTIDDRILPAAVLRAGGLAIEIARLRVELRRQLAEVEASRARILVAGDEERHRLERDLHDGAQQRLVSVGLALRHAQHELDGGTAARARETLDGAVTQIEVAIDDLRELARGFRPAQLDAGLAAALRELAQRSPLPVVVNATRERFPEGVETAAYFIACEGLTNAVKHARASRVVIDAALLDAKLVVQVADDGVGGATATSRSGLAGISDRIATQGGRFRIDSPPGGGTRLVAELPCAS